MENELHLMMYGKPSPKKELPKVITNSFEKDAERWIDSYINHTATVLRQRALAQQNGHRERA